MPDRPDRPRPSPRQLAAWCEQEQQRLDQLPWLQRPEALLRMMTVLVSELSAEHGEDELGIATDHVLEAVGEHLGSSALSAALASWARAPEPRPGEPLRPPPGLTDGDEADEQVAEWFNEFEFTLANLPEDEDEDEDVDGEDDGLPPLRA